MRRLLIIYVCLSLALLGGCSASLEADTHDVERLLLIQTLGLDSIDGGIEMSVSSGLGPEDAPALVMSVQARGIEDAIARLQNYSPENQLFYAHVQYLLLGEGAAEKELQKVIEWVDRSPTLRMDTEMLVVRGRARDAVVDVSEDAADITQRLASLDRQARSMGWTIHTLREAAAALAQRDGALALAVEAVPTEGKVFTDEQQSAAVVPMGYAVLGPEGLLEFLSPEASLGAELLTGDPTGLLITVSGCTMEILDSSARIEAARDENGAPCAVTVRCRLRTGVLERDAGEELSPEALDAALCQTVSAWVGEAVEKAQAFGCDYLGAKKAVLTSADDLARYGGEWDQLFPALPVTVQVEGRVDRSYDLAE